MALSEIPTPQTEGWEKLKCHLGSYIKKTYRKPSEQLFPNRRLLSNPNLTKILKTFRVSIISICIILQDIHRITTQTININVGSKIVSKPTFQCWSHYKRHLNTCTGCNLTSSDSSQTKLVQSYQDAKDKLLSMKYL